MIRTLAAGTTLSLAALLAGCPPPEIHPDPARVDPVPFDCHISASPGGEVGYAGSFCLGGYGVGYFQLWAVCGDGRILAGARGVGGPPGVGTFSTIQCGWIGYRQLEIDVW